MRRLGVGGRLGGFFCLGILAWGHLVAQEPEDPFAAPAGSQKVRSDRAKKPLPEAFEGDERLGVGVMAEWIEVELKELPGLLRDHGGKADAKDLYETLEAWSKEGKARSVEVVFGRFPIGSRGRIESVDEVIYATEYDPPEIPNTVRVGDGSDESLIPRTPAVPTAFETRNVGTTIEADTQVEESRLIRLSIAGQTVNFLGRDYHLGDDAAEEGGGIEVIWMPKFHTMAISTHLSLESGTTALVGSFRPPAELAAPDRRWLCFVRADVIVAEREDQPGKEAAE